MVSFNQTKTKLILALLTAGLISTISAQAVGSRGGHQWGPFRALPRVNLDYIATDNLFNTKNREKSSGIVVINPGLTLEAGTASMKYILDADITAGHHTRSDDDDYADLALSGQAIYSPNSRIKLDLSAAFAKGHEARGTGRSEGATSVSGIEKPDEFDKSNLGAEFTYGVAGAKGQIILSLDYTNLEYTNNRAGTRPRDRDGYGQGGIFKWRVAPKTRVLVEFRNNEIDYDFTPAGTAKLDSDEQHYLLGVEWQATYKTAGSFKIGRMHKDFDSSSRSDISSGTWEAGIVWKPRSYSTVNISTGRAFGETNGTGDASESDYFSVAWSHAWVERFSTTLSYDYSGDEYPGSATLATSKRKDDTDTYALAANYKARRWLTLGAGIEHVDKESNISAIDYERNNLFVNASMKF